MEEKLIKEETATLAKEIGFTLGIGWFGFDDYRFYYNGELTTNYRENNPVACTQFYLQKYLREVHNCFIEIRWHSPLDGSPITKENIRWVVEVDYYGKNFDREYDNESDILQGDFLTYEDALEYGLFESIKLIKKHEILP